MEQKYYFSFFYYGNPLIKTKENQKDKINDKKSK